MDGYSTAVFVFLAYIVGQLTFFLIPSLPISILVGASSVVLAAILLWHWTQFSVEYRMSTWQEGLRNYASYFLVFLVIILTYGYYVFSQSGGNITEIAQKAQTNMRNTGSNVLNKSSRAISSIVEAIQPSVTKTNTNVFPSFSPKNAPTANALPNMNFLSKKNAEF